jgi:two-component system, NarL family, sensor histidine kinase DegS
MTSATDFWRRFWERLHDRRFWMVQVLVLAIAAAHTTIEAKGELQNTQDLYLVPIYFVPVLYAALNFGVEGALPTGLWCLLLTLPNIVLVHHGAEGIGVLAQLVFLVLLGSMVAIRIDTERRAKLAAEDANRRLAEVQASLKSFIRLALRAQEEERFRLSRELHDETVQELVVAKAALENVPGGEGQHARLELVDAALQRCIDGIRRFCRALRPSILDDLGLVPALEWLLSDLSDRTGIRTTLEEHGDRLRLDPGQELVIFRVAQEALHNIEHHAHASQVKVRLAYDPGPLCLEVVDDGCGFDPAQDRQGRLGLAGMQERASLISAAFEVLSHPGETCVRLDLPPVSNPAAVDLVPDATDPPYDWTTGFRRP